MLSRLASRATGVATKVPTALSVRHDSHYHPIIPNSQSLTQAEVISRLDKDIEDRTSERFRWEKMGVPYTQTYVISDYGYEYVQGGGSGLIWMAFGVVSLAVTSYLFFNGRYHDPYVYQRNPGPDLAEYQRIKERLVTEPDFWNWDQRDGVEVKTLEWDD